MIAVGVQLDGLNTNLLRLISTLTCLICRGMPSRMCGIAYGPDGSVVTVNAEVIGLTSTFARTTTFPTSRLLGSEPRLLSSAIPSSTLAVR